MRLTMAFAVAFFGLAPLAIAQGEEEPAPGGTPEKEKELPDGAVVVDLVAGQTEIAGTVTAWNDGDHLYVKYQTTGAWVMHETQLAVALDWSDIPQKAGNPTPGAFEFKGEHGDQGVTVVTHEIPLEDTGWEAGDLVYLAAHAELSLATEDGEIVEEGGWGDGDGFPGASWAMYFAYEIHGVPPEEERAEEDPPEKGTEKDETPPEEEDPTDGGGSTEKPVEQA